MYVSQQYLPLSQSVFDLLLVAFQVVVERASKVMISCQVQQQETGASVIGPGRQEESTWLSSWPRLSTVTSWGPLCQTQRINSWVIIFPVLLLVPLTYPSSRKYNHGQQLCTSCPLSLLVVFYCCSVTTIYN